MKVSTPSAINVAVLVTDFHSALSVLSPTPLFPPNQPCPTPLLLFLLLFSCFPQIWSLDACPLAQVKTFLCLFFIALFRVPSPSFQQVCYPFSCCSGTPSCPFLLFGSECLSFFPRSSPHLFFPFFLSASFSAVRVPPISFAPSPCAPSSPSSVSSFSFAPISSPSSSFVPPPISSPLPSPPAFVFSTSISSSPCPSLSPAALIPPVSPKRGLLPPPSSLPVSLPIKGSDYHVSKRQTRSSTQASGVKLSSQIPPHATRSSSSKVSALPSSESPIQPSSK